MSGGVTDVTRAIVLFNLRYVTDLQTRLLSSCDDNMIIVSID